MFSLKRWICKKKKIKGTLQVLEKQLPLKIARKHRRKNIWLGVSPKDGQSGACRIQHNNFTTTTISKCPAMVQGLSPARSIPHCCSQELHNNSPCSAGGEKHRVQQARAGGVGRNPQERPRQDDSQSPALDHPGASLQEHAHPGDALLKGPALVLGHRAAGGVGSARVWAGPTTNVTSQMLRVLDPQGSN